MAIPPTPLTDAEVAQTLFDMEGTIRYRLRLKEIIPVEMSRYHIGKSGSFLNPTELIFPVADGRVHFIVPKLFNTSLCLRSGDKNDGWFFVHVEFLITVGGDLTGLQGSMIFGQF
jgi:mediator of RNA polymerase II transcription subunit 14